MRYVALLRAINVGGRTVKMDRLRVLFEEMKLQNVQTYIASGNVIFDSSAAAASSSLEMSRHSSAAARSRAVTSSGRRLDE